MGQLDEPSRKPSPCTVTITGLCHRPLDSHTILLYAIKLGVNMGTLSTLEICRVGYGFVWPNSTKIIPMDSAYCF